MPRSNKANNRRTTYIPVSSVGELRACTVSYQDYEATKHSVEVAAESLYEAAILGMKAMRVPNWQNAPNLDIEVRVRAPEVVHSISNAVLAAWLSRRPKKEREQALAARLRELIRS